MIVYALYACFEYTYTYIHNMFLYLIKEIKQNDLNSDEDQSNSGQQVTEELALLEEDSEKVI